VLKRGAGDIYDGQVSGENASPSFPPFPLLVPPTITGGGLDYHYPDYDTVWSITTCKNDNSRPFNNKNNFSTYETMLACCKGAYAGQQSGAFLAQLATPLTTSPTTERGLKCSTPAILAWPEAECITNDPISSGRPSLRWCVWRAD